MTEEEWLEATCPVAMFRGGPRRPSDRKLRLFAVACCRLIWPLLADERSRRAIEVAEDAADSRATDETRSLARRAAFKAHDECFRHLGKRGACLEMAAAYVIDDVPYHAAKCVSWMAATSRQPGDVTRAELSIQSQIVRHMLGNPFRPYPAPACWPASIVGLAQALYDGHDNCVVLADALEEVDHLELASHFRADEWHPKGCWVVDLILGKQ